jgi:putative ABC transport system substrate-binding protein
VVALPLGANAQAPTSPVIGFLNSASPGPFAKFLAAFHQGLKEEGYVEGQNVVIEHRWAEGHYDRLPMLAADLARRKVAVISATGGSVTARAARDATATIPIVFLGGAEPVGIGLVSSFNRPGANVTGVSTYTSELAPKRLELLYELLSRADKIATLTNPENPTDLAMQQMGAPTSIPGLQLLALTAKAESDFEPALAEAVRQRVDGILVSSDPFFNSRRAQLVAVAARHALPAAYAWREYVEAGGLMSYGTSLPGSYRQIGKYVGRILKGAKPLDLPVQNPTSFVFALNLTTAKALGLKVPPSIMLLANVVIEP